MKVKSVIVILSVFVLLMAACSAPEQQPIVTSGDDPEPGSIVQDVEGTAMPVPAPGNENVKEMVVVEDTENDVMGEAKAAPSKTVEFDIDAMRWEFSPSLIKVKKGDMVRLRITSTDVNHGFKINQYEIDEFLTPGKTTEVEFVADKAGTFPFFCNVFCGQGHSEMRGTLIVEE